MLESQNSARMELRILVMKSKYGTSKAIAEALDLQESTVSRWLQGRSHPEAENFKALAQMLDIPATTLLELLFAAQEERQKEEEA